jgi:hypothetical protein
LVWLQNAAGQVPQGPQVTMNHILLDADAAEIDGYLDHYGLQHEDMDIGHRRALLLNHLAVR